MEMQSAAFLVGALNGFGCAGPQRRNAPGRRRSGDRLFGHQPGEAQRTGGQKRCSPRRELNACVADSTGIHGWCCGAEANREPCHTTETAMESKLQQSVECTLYSEFVLSRRWSRRTLCSTCACLWFEQPAGRPAAMRVATVLHAVFHKLGHRRWGQFKSASRMQGRYGPQHCLCLGIVGRWRFWMGISQWEPLDGAPL